MAKVKQKTRMSAGKVVQLNKGSKVLTSKALCQTAGHRSVIDLDEVIAMHECGNMTSFTTHEEADTLMIHHAVEVASNGYKKVYLPQDCNKPHTLRDAVTGRNRKRLARCEYIHKPRMCCFWLYQGHHFLATVLRQS